MNDVDSEKHTYDLVSSRSKKKRNYTSGQLSRLATTGAVILGSLIGYTNATEVLTPFETQNIKGVIVQRDDGTKSYYVYENAGKSLVNYDETLKTTKLEDLRDKSLEDLVDFCGVQINRGDRDGLYGLFENPENYFGEHRGWIKHENNRIIYVESSFDPKEELVRIGNLSALRTLILHNINSLPESIGRLKRLETLSIDRTEITSLPESFGDLTSLKELDLIFNQLTSLPESFGNLKSLVYLSFNGNSLYNLPESFGNLTSLEYLHLSSNKLTSLPDSFGNLSSLEYLKLSNNLLSSLPESFGDLKSLKELHIGFNELTSLPESFGNLSSLEYLFLFHNNLINLPESFGSLKTLKTLGIEDNNISSFPYNFEDLQSLGELNIRNNPLSHQSKELLKKLREKGVKVYFTEN